MISQLGPDRLERSSSPGQLTQYQVRRCEMRGKSKIDPGQAEPCPNE
jgi:hypothetical protein